MALDYDFYINSLGFNTKISEKSPYERATAQFRKDQFDSTPTVGDQSLAGWWTRGQLSFHKGAGIKYYEVLDGDTVLNRFQDSTGIDPWTPGEVTLTDSTSQVALTNVDDAVGATYGGNPGVDVLKAGDLTFVSSTVGSTRHASDYSDFLSVTTSGSATYATTAKAIEGPAGSPTLMGTNFVKDPRFYTNNWAHGVDLQSFTINNGNVTFFSYNAGVTTAEFYPSPWSPGFTVGKTYRAVVDQRGTTHAVSIILDGSVLVSGSTARVEGTFVATSPSHAVHVRADTVGQNYTIHEFSVTDDLSASSLNPHDSSDYVWTGSADDSKSTRTIATGDPKPLWYPVAGRTWVKAWWAKGRFFALDSAGKWFTLSTAGGTATDVDNLFWNPSLGTTGWSVAESPSAVYISHGTDIYKITPDADGLIPAITTPVVAASFPTGETISSIYCYLGRLIACTNLGIRVALVQEDGRLAYGPHAVEGDFSKTVRVTALKELAYVAGTKAGDTLPSLYAVNMLDDIADLQPVFAKLMPLNAGTVFGTTVTPDGKLMTWDGSGFFRTGSGLQTTGYVTTGFHRLGTLDPKSFQFLRVKTEGTVGSVAVKALLPDGTETTVGTVAAGGSEDLALATAVPGPVEYVAFKFTLTGDGTDGPTLLGYQLKALPIPKRQRMVRVPLMLFDKELNRTGAATAGDAWSRLAALEALEQSNAVITFTDKETGETGTGYIEAVEVQRTSPSSRTEGFGGLLYVTIRKI